MKYPQKLALRLIVSILIVTILYNIINFILLKLTFYGVYPFLFFKYNPNILGDSFIVGNFALKIIPACVATSAYLLLYLLILLTKDIKLKLGLKLALAGSLLIFVVNIIRIDFLIYVFLKFGQNLFDTIHLIFWKFVSSLYVAIVWIFLIKKYKIKNIPIYTDFKFLISKSKKKSKKRKKS
tara:strand:+ start:12718 stop:13260 length:543 start_codon:yes stop_codon:yes gene_type:complete